MQTSVMEGAMNQTTATNVPQDAVVGVMKQAADEAGLELNMELAGAASNTMGNQRKILIDNVVIKATLCSYYIAPLKKTPRP